MSEKYDDMLMAEATDAVMPQIKELEKKVQLVMDKLETMPRNSIAYPVNESKNPFFVEVKNLRIALKDGDYESYGKIAGEIAIDVLHQEVQEKDMSERQLMIIEKLLDKALRSNRITIKDFPSSYYLERI